jgi:hypothetical protein
MKALMRFSYMDKTFDEGDAVEGIPDEALETLLNDGVIGKGKGTEQSKEPAPGSFNITEKVQTKAEDYSEKEKIEKPGKSHK